MTGIDAGGLESVNQRAAHRSNGFIAPLPMMTDPVPPARKMPAFDAIEHISYARPTDRLFRRTMIRSLERLSGKRRLVRLYRIWRGCLQGGDLRPFETMLDLMDIRLDVSGVWPPRGVLPDRLVMVANHPFGIGDGAAMLALAEQLGRPCRILIHNDLMRILEMATYGLPVSFEETKDAIALNIETKRRAARLLADGTTIIVFPAGGVATAPRGFGAAKDLPWKQFTAGLVRAGRAAVLPVHCAGQNGRLFHLASKLSLTIRLGLLVGEFRRLAGHEIRLTVGTVIPEAELGAIGDRRRLTDHLREAVFALG